MKFIYLKIELFIILFPLFINLNIFQKKFSYLIISFLLDGT